MTTEQQRKEFEEWISAEPYLYSVERWPRFHVNHGDYVTLDVRVAWAAWQQSAARNKDSERLKKLADMTWDVRWSVDPESKDDLVFAIAAEIRSGNFEGIDNKIKEQHERQR